MSDEPVDVEDPNERVLLHVGDQSFVDMLHNPVEEFGVDVFGQCVPGVGGLKTREGLHVRLCGCFQLPVTQPLSHVLIGHAHQVTERCQVTIVGLQENKRLKPLAEGRKNMVVKEELMY